MIHIGVIGCGNRMREMLRLVLNLGMDIALRAVADPSPKIREELKAIGTQTEHVRFYADADEMLSREELDGVMVGTRCSLHTEMALKVLKKRLPMFLEKPVAMNYEQLHTLKAAYEASGSPVVVSFPLRRTIHANTAKQLIQSGQVGEIMHVCALNYVPYGGDYYHSWYRDDDETGGLWLQKATHDFDYINDLVGLRPVEICAMDSKQIMKGDKPAGLRCEDCAEKFTCPEGPFQLVNTTGDRVHGPWCCYAEDTGNQDSGSAIIRYENGMHATYTQNFFIRNQKTARRGAILSGTKATVEFDWVTDTLKLTRHYTPGESVYRLNAGASQHGGGDFQLALNFAEILRGANSSEFPLEAGLLSAYMCLKARDSGRDGRFMKLNEQMT